VRFQAVDCVQADELIASGNTIVIDVRDQEAYDAAHIHGAIRLAVNSLDDFCDSIEKNKNIIVYCYHGISSQSVAQYLIDQGMTNVYSLTGGYEVWKDYHDAASDN
jgi:thiosulfate sulfurtransferase